MDKKSMLDAIIAYYTGGNKARFATLLGVSAQTISAWGSRNTFDSELIYTKCIGISSEWLLTGEGSMLRDNKNAENTMGYGTEKVQPTSSDAVTLRLIEKIDEKDAKIDHLQSELLSAKEELATLKAYYQHPDETVIAFTPGSSEAYTESSLPGKPSTSSKRSSVRKM